MDRLYFDDYIDMAEYMYDEATDDIYIVAVLYYEDAIKLLRELLSFDDVEISALDIEPPLYNGYDREYYVSLDEYKTLSVEPAYVGDIYLNTDADKLLIDGAAHSGAISDMPLDHCYEVLVDEIDDEFAECETNHIHNFTFSLSDLLKMILGELEL